jgi:hypothetical protein
MAAAIVANRVRVTWILLVLGIEIAGELPAEHEDAGWRGFLPERVSAVRRAYAGAGL